MLASTVFKQNLFGEHRATHTMGASRLPGSISSRARAQQSNSTLPGKSCYRTSSAQEQIDSEQRGASSIGKDKVARTVEA